MVGRDRVSGFFFFVISIFVGVKASQFPFGTMKRLGPGFFPLVLSLLLGVLSLVLLLRSFGGREKDPIDWPKHGGNNLIFISLAIFAFSLLLKPLGFLFTTILFTGVAFKFADPGRWVGPGLAALIATAVSYFVFKVGLGIPFPAGILGY